jgi:hypothetical protein
VTVVSSGAMSADDPDWGPDEHVRFARYRRAFDEVAPVGADNYVRTGQQPYDSPLGGWNPNTFNS